MSKYSSLSDFPTSTKDEILEIGKHKDSQDLKFVADHMREWLRNKSIGLAQSDVLVSWYKLECLLNGIGFRTNKLEEAVVVCLDFEWFEFDESRITEVGVATIPASDFHGTAKLRDCLRNIKITHARIKRNSYLYNRGQENNPFVLGKSRFVTWMEARRLLLRSFLHENKDGHLKPIIFLGHAIENDIQKIKEPFCIDLEKIGVIIAIVDTQVIAKEQRIYKGTRSRSLKDLLNAYSIDMAGLHNAGNDVLGTIAAAFFMAKYPHCAKPNPTPINFSEELENMHLYLKDNAKAEDGIEIYCTFCTSETHLVHDHVGNRARKGCEKCFKDPLVHHLSDSHKPEFCQVTVASHHRVKVVIPCEPCTLSTDPSRYDKAFTHITTDCPFGRRVLAHEIGAS